LQRGGGLGQRAHPSVQAGRRGGRRRALAQFQQQWGTYRKIVEGDLLSHREIGRILHDTLNDVFKQPFSFLDIACGDAFVMKTALNGTRIRHYHGIDLSQPALDLAARNLANLPCPVDLDHRDFVEAMMLRQEHADAAWCSLSIHHLSTNDKLGLMKAIRGATGKRGMFMLYEPTRLVGEDRTAFLARFERVNQRLWNVLTPPEWQQIRDHVTACDFPETSAVVRARPRGGLPRRARSVRRSDGFLPALSLRELGSGVVTRPRARLFDLRRPPTPSRLASWRPRLRSWSPTH